VSLKTALVSESVELEVPPDPPPDPPLDAPAAPAEPEA
jgi:hypothetical protein